MHFLLEGFRNTPCWTDHVGFRMSIWGAMLGSLKQFHISFSAKFRENSNYWAQVVRYKCTILNFQTAILWDAITSSVLVLTSCLMASFQAHLSSSWKWKYENLCYNPLWTLLTKLIKVAMWNQWIQSENICPKWNSWKRSNEFSLF